MCEGESFEALDKIHGQLVVTGGWLGGIREDRSNKWEDGGFNVAGQRS